MNPSAGFELNSFQTTADDVGMKADTVAPGVGLRINVPYLVGDALRGRIQHTVAKQSDGEDWLDSKPETLRREALVSRGVTMTTDLLRINESKP